MSDSGKLSVGWLYDDSLKTNDGVAQYVKTLGAWLSDQGHEVSYLVGQSDIKSWHGAPVYSLSKNLKVRWGGNRMSTPLKPGLRTINSLLDQKSFDVIHVTVPYSPLMAMQVINRLDTSTALVGTWHIYPSSRKTDLASRLLKPIYGRSLRRFDSFISVSPVAQAYAQRVFKQPSIVLPNVVDRSKFPAQPRTNNDRPRIVFLGRLVKRKGAKQLIDAAGYLKDKLNYSDFELIIAGDGPERKNLEKQARLLGLSDQITFLGYVDEAAKKGLLSIADVACFPSMYGESFGIVLIEAMAAGARVILGGDNPGYRSVLGVQPKMLVNPAQTVSFAERLHELLEQKQLIAKLHSWQNNEIKKYDVAVVGPKLLSIYQSAIAKRRSSGHN